MPRTRQHERRAATRARIVDAATRLFCRDGYVATTMGAIATEAGVAVQTLYLSFGSKVAILSAAHDVAVVGDAQPVPLLEREWVRRLPDAPDGATAVTIATENLSESTQRVAGVYAVIQNAAADPLVADLLDKLRGERIASCTALADRLLAAAGDPGSPARDRLADVLYTLMGVETYRMLVLERGWSPLDYQGWAYDVLLRQLADA